MGSQSQKKKIKSRLVLNIIAVFIILPLLLELTVKAGILVFSPNSQLIDVYAESELIKSDFVEFLNVGQADCTIIKSGESAAVIDFGVEEDGEKIYKTLLKYGIKSIDYAVITHHHSDHMGGFLRVAEKIKVKNLIKNNSTAKDGEVELYKRIIALAKREMIKIHLPVAGESFNIGKSVLEILSCNALAAEENNRSIVTMLTISGKNLLFTGDADGETERLITKNCNIKCDILKMGHHGSNTASDAKFLKTAAPEIAVASCGYDNSYNHPSKGAVLRVKEQGIRLYRTDLDRGIRCVFGLENESYDIIVGRGDNK